MVSNKASLKPIAGLIILTFIQMIFMYIYFDRWEIEEQKKRNALLVTVIVYSFSILLMKFISLVADGFDVTIAFLFPTALATMLVRLLADDRAAVLITVMTAASAGVIFQEGYSSVMQMEITLYIIFGGFASLFFMRSVEKRSHIMQAVAVISVVNMGFIAFYLLMTQSSYGLSELLFYFIAAILSALLSGALTMGLLPFFESAFSLLSTLRLIELSNPNHPLLKKLLMETPGTYHHSVMVANLAEAACEAIGADGLLARVGCYYHDIGKTKRPAFFIENQMSGMNPHDSMPPETSAEIIIAHTTDGAEMLRRYKMPQEIIDIALQHHGTSLLKFFLYKAKEEGKVIDEAKFRYPGPKPQTKEAAVISVADSVEAAVRSMKEPNAEKIHKLVRAIIDDRVQDHQFDECDISIKELKCIEQVLCETLNGIFHSRIEYPKADK
ncbi:HD family phosphohydrolase OS=Lysinibacillus sphaericus OX=1421 GN=LS41612_08045 PE=4 SV=1 [Lysinibacillus sphaericus]